MKPERAPSLSGIARTLRLNVSDEQLYIFQKTKKKSALKNLNELERNFITRVLEIENDPHDNALQTTLNQQEGYQYD